MKSNNSAEDSSQKKYLYQKWWFWAAIVLILLIGVGSANQNPASPDIETPNTAQLSPESQPASSPQTIPDPKEGSAPADTAVPSNVYHVGDTLEVDGLAISFTDAEEWTEFNEFMKPKAGKKYFRIHISAQNNASGDRGITPYDFTCYADGKTQEISIYGDEPLHFAMLSTGRIAEGYLYYEIPESTSQLELEYETDFWKNEKAVFSYTF